MEDSASEALYTKLIAKILDSGITIKKIIPLKFFLSIEKPKIVFLKAIKNSSSKINEKKYIGELLSILFIFIPFMFNNYPFFCFFPSNVIQLSRNILNFSWINRINSIYLEFIGLLCVAILLFFLVCRKNRKEI